MILDLAVFYSILPVAFQVSGALLLLIFNISSRRKNIIKQFAGKGLIGKDNNTNEISYNKEALKKEFEGVYINKIAFGLIALGYILDENNKGLVVLLIITIIVIMIISYLIVKLIVRYFPNVNKELTDGELITYDIEPDYQNISNQMIDDIVNEVIDDNK